MIFIDISNNNKAQLEALFCDNEVYAAYFEMIDGKCGYRDNASSGGDIFYYIKGKKRGKKIYNEVTGKTIRLY